MTGDLQNASVFPHQRWTQTHLSDLRQRVHAGETLDRIAVTLGRPVEDVAAMASRLRLRAKLASEQD